MAIKIPNSPGVYEIRNVRNSRRYIGSTVSLRKRWGHHLYRLNRGDHPNPAMQMAWNKYGDGIFTFHIIEIVPEPLLLAREQYWLDKKRAWANREYYNVLELAGSHTGRKRSQETRRKLSAANKGRTFSVETKQKMRDAKVGKTLSVEHRKKLSESRRGKAVRRPEGIINHSIRCFTSEQVMQIRARKAAGISYRVLCEEYGTYTGNIYRIVHRKTYKDVP